MEPELLKSAIILIAVFIVPTFLALFSIKRPPEWIAGGVLAPFWSKINLLSLITSVALSLITFLTLSAYMIEFRAVATLSSAVLSFITVQTFFTDFAHRRADRRVLRIANLLSLIAGYWFLNTYDKSNLIFYAVFAISATAVLFVKSIGDSDARALQLVVLSGLPVVGIFGMQLGIVGFLILTLTYGAALAIKSRSFKLLLTKKTSIPAVPLIVAPFAILVLFLPLLPVR
jgi:hypothetical protein